MLHGVGHSFFTGEAFMKVLLVAINAKYIHSNLAAYSLKTYAERYVENSCLGIEIAEYTINQQEEDIWGDIYRRVPDILCFSCYIWNWQYVQRIIREIKKLLPETVIWVGGPEVSYDANTVLRDLPQVKGVMKGEGEKTFAELCVVYGDIWEQRIKGELSLEKALGRTEGITFRCYDGEIVVNPWREPVSLDEVPFAYGNMEAFADRIVYYESSRGCPFSCSYCLSSVDRRLRFRSTELVKRELQFFLDHRVSQVKFVDRTFNCRHERVLEIWKYIIEHDNGITNFHFEVAADLFIEEELLLIEKMRPGNIQLEIGVQSVNTKTLREIRRKMQIQKVKVNVERIRGFGNVHQHLDLIAGLPYEDITSFAKSFDEVYKMRPEQLQLGFLKVLKGSYMEEKKEEYALVCRDDPPYEVLYTKWLSYADILELKGVEEMLEIYYNSGQFVHSMEYLWERYASAYEMYWALWKYYEKSNLLGIQHKRSARYEILLEFVREYFPGTADVMREILIYDYYLRENAKARPAFAGEYLVPKEFIRKFYEKEEQERRYLPGYEAYDKNQMRKMTHIEYFPNLKKMLLFDYKCRNPLNREARTCMIKLVQKKEEKARNEF